MAQEKTYVSITALAICFATACGDKTTNPPPQSPADQTTTTGGAETTAPSATTTGQTNTTSSYPSKMGPEAIPPAVPSPLDSTAGTTVGAGSPASGVASPGVATAGTTGSDHPVADLSDGDIVAIIQVADRGEIDQAREAVRKARSARVKQFAQRMISDHSAAEAKLARVDNTAEITPRESTISADLRSSGGDILGNLKSSTSGDFDRTYIDAQVTEHTKLLELLDDKLIPRAQNAELGKALQEVRAKVASHLKMAQDIQGSLQAK